jgi:hypothetical protein
LKPLATHIPAPVSGPAVPILVWILFVVLALAFGWLFVQVQEFQRRQRKLVLSQDEMKKEFKLQGDELSKKLVSLTEKSTGSAALVEETRNLLTVFEDKLESLFASITKVESTIPELIDLNRKLTEAKAKLDAFASEVNSATVKTGELENSHDAAVRRIKELDVAILELQQLEGTANVLPNRASIQEAASRASELARQQGATPEAQLARRLAAEEGELILRAFDAAARADVEGAASIIDASSYDPFVLHQNLWQGAIAAKRTLELARAAALTAMEPLGFKLEKPKVGIDMYDKDAHDLRDSYPTMREDLKGKIAEVRRPGLSYKGKIIRPARVVQYAIDYAKVAPAPAPTAPVAVTPEPVPVPIEPPTKAPAPPASAPAPEPAERKGGISQF